MTALKLALQFVILLCIAQLTWSKFNVNTDWENSDWESPDAFSQRRSLSSGKKLNHNDDGICKCESTGTTKDDHLPSLYKKIVKFLLKRDSMKFDKSSRIYYRSLHLYINEQQMDRFNKMTDVHDMDQLLSEVLYQSRSGTFELFQEMYLNWRDTFIWYWQLILSSRQVVIGLQFAVFVLVWFASRKFKFRFSVVALFFVLFYLYSFLDAECHRKKEIEKVAQMHGMNQENPCKTTSFWGYYFRNQNADCKKYLENSYDVSCTLIDVYEEFVNVFLYKQMWNFIDNSIANILKVYASYGIMGALCVTLICVFLFYNYFKLIIESMFIHIFKPFLSSRSASDRQQSLNGAGDTISKDVLNKILDITINQTKLNALHLSRLNLNSGVQQIDVVDGNDNGDNEKLKDVDEDATVQLIAPKGAGITDISSTNGTSSSTDDTSSSTNNTSSSTNDTSNNK